MSKNDRSVNYEWPVTYSGSSDNWNNREMCSLQNLYEETAFLRLSLFSPLWSCQLISPSSNSQCLAGVLYFTIVSFRGPWRSRESWVELVCLEMAGRETNRQCPQLNTQHLVGTYLSVLVLQRQPQFPEHIYIYLTTPRNAAWTPIYPWQCGKLQLRKALRGQAFDLWIKRSQCPSWV